ncbi:hypothetical protein HXX76_003126 [Chlamydomonas incerta]|uniref:Uncharacterized protein n=1 Tax=Chlamydomonas incerta TaxID=51695 RepID=A0A835T9W2_CHLIN|nr:hypothetical protein HXX76_003126 [Chlamydomonas incerta]|eukprot:KAG2441504.1 hypothetical protein HXX76_003126 [Chlamydomonas incerta]
MPRPPPPSPPPAKAYIDFVALAEPAACLSYAEDSGGSWAVGGAGARAQLDEIFMFDGFDPVTCAQAAVGWYRYVAIQDNEWCYGLTPAAGQDQGLPSPGVSGCFNCFGPFEGPYLPRNMKCGGRAAVSVYDLYTLFPETAPGPVPGVYGFSSN